MKAEEPSPAPSGAGDTEEKRLYQEEVAARLEEMSARQALEWAFGEFGSSLYFACSFQKTSSVMVHMATSINPAARFFYLDTDVLFPETYAIRDLLSGKYGVQFDRWHGLSLEAQAERYGDRLWAKDPDACCGLRKVEPMREALSGVDCWVAGVRREDSATRANAPKFAWDSRFDLWKLNPLADWSERDVWDYLNEHDVPYNPLHDQGYPSIGCTHCTQPVHPGQDARQGRWSGSGKTECGIN